MRKPNQKQIQLLIYLCNWNCFFLFLKEIYKNYQNVLSSFFKQRNWNLCMICVQQYVKFVYELNRRHLSTVTFE